VTPWVIAEYSCALFHLLRPYVAELPIDATAIVPVKVDSPHRLEHIQAIIPYLIDNLRFKEVFVVETDTEPRLARLLPEGVRYFFVQQRASDDFSRAVAVNTALHSVQTNITALWDVDCICPFEQLYTASRAVLAGADSARPYQTFVSTRRRGLDSLRLGRVHYSELDKHSIWQMPEPTGPQAMCLFNTGVLKHIRGLSDLFYDYGGEDVELSNRMIKLGLKHVIIPGRGYHFAHTRSLTSQPRERSVQLNYGEAWRIAEMSTEEVRAYYGITETVGAYSKLVRPAPFNKVFDTASDAAGILQTPAMTRQLY
jgi:hypothetical protein